MDDIADSEVFDWIGLYAGRIDALLAEIGQRYPAGPPYGLIARDEVSRGLRTAQFYERELAKWLKCR